MGRIPPRRSRTLASFRLAALLEESQCVRATQLPGALVSISRILERIPQPPLGLNHFTVIEIDEHFLLLASGASSTCEC